MTRARARLLAQTYGALAGVLASPALALACPVCFSAKDEASRIAFLATTVFLTALPLLLIGGIVMWLSRRVQAADQASAEVAEPEPGAETAPDAVTGARPLPTRG